MNNLKNLVVLCSMYPNDIYPSSQVFIQQLVWALADLGIECTVICPIATNQYPELRTLKEYGVEKTPSGNQVSVFFPKYISFGQRNIFGFKTARLSTFFYYRAVSRIWENFILKKPDVVYGHFFTPAGISAARIAKKHLIRSFVAYGESSPWSILNFGVERMKKEVSCLDGVVAVSSSNKSDLDQFGLLSAEKVKVFPNGIRVDHFFVRDREKSRLKFGFPQDSFIIAFSGHFSNRKGVLRLRDAVDGLADIYVIYAGKGELEPTSNNTLFKGLVSPKDMPEFLSAADLYVLPTLNEGCSNAIVEAIACGLPIISSDLPFNHDILDSSNSVLIDPHDIDKLREVILMLKNNKMELNRLRSGALVKAKFLSVEERALRIKKWIEEVINNN